MTEAFRCLGKLPPFKERLDRSGNSNGISAPRNLKKARRGLLVQLGRTVLFLETMVLHHLGRMRISERMQERLAECPVYEYCHRLSKRGRNDRPTPLKAVEGQMRM